MPNDEWTEEEKIVDEWVDTYNGIIEYADQEYRRFLIMESLSSLERVRCSE